MVAHPGGVSHLRPAAGGNAMEATASESRFALEMLESLADKEPADAPEPESMSALRESVSTDNDKEAGVVEVAPLKIKPTS